MHLAGLSSETAEERYFHLQPGRKEEGERGGGKGEGRGREREREGERLDECAHTTQRNVEIWLLTYVPL